MLTGVRCAMLMTSSLSSGTPSRSPRGGGGGGIRRGSGGRGTMATPSKYASTLTPTRGTQLDDDDAYVDIGNSIEVVDVHATTTPERSGGAAGRDSDDEGNGTPSSSSKSMSRRPSRADILARAVARRKHAQPGYGGILGAGVLVRRSSQLMMSVPQRVLTALVAEKEGYVSQLKVTVRVFGMGLYQLAEDASLNVVHAGCFAPILSLFELLQTIVGLELELLEELRNISFDDTPNSLYGNLGVAGGIAAAFEPIKAMYPLAYERYHSVLAWFGPAIAQVSSQHRERYDAYKADAERDAQRCVDEGFKAARSYGGSASASGVLPVTLEEWISVPAGYPVRVVDGLKQVQHMYSQQGRGEAEASIASVVQLHAELAVAPPAAANSCVSAEAQEEFRRLCEKKFRSSCPKLYVWTTLPPPSSTSLFFFWWFFWLVKSRTLVCGALHPHPIQESRSIP